MVNINNSNRKYRLRPLLVPLFNFLALTITATIFSLFLIITFRLSEPISMNIAVIAGYFFTSVCAIVVSKFKKRKNQPYTLILIGVIYFSAIQSFLLLTSPLHSVIPEKYLIRTNILTPVFETTECDNEKAILKAKNFMANQIDTSPLKMYYLNNFGEIFNLVGKSDIFIATTWGNFVYFPKNGDCPTEELLVHELTHVWQYQTGQGFGLKWNLLWIFYMWSYLTDHTALYDYGSYEGLDKAVREGKSFTNFSLEQQAVIVEHYYYFSKRKDTPGFENVDNSYGYKLLEHFVENEFRKTINLN